MPRVDVLLPGLIFRATNLKCGLKADIKRIVAEEMGGKDYEGSDFTLDPSDVEIVITSYEDVDVDLAARYPLTITGYDYPERMDAEIIERKLGMIAIRLLAALGLRLGPDLMKRELEIAIGTKQEVFSATFVAYRRGCYADSRIAPN